MAHLQASLVAKTDRLSAREEKILKLLMEGYSTAAIARDLKVSTATVQATIHQITHKLKARSDEAPG
jgi:DNA-binding CsgD family transcriptional regulator